MSVKWTPISWHGAVARAGSWHGAVARAGLLLLILAWIAPRSPLSPPPSSSESGAAQASVWVIGVDGASWPILQELMARGRLPNFSRLVHEGASGHLASFQWMRFVTGELGWWSPIIWTTVATGRSPADHGVLDFQQPTGNGFGIEIAHFPATLRLPEEERAVAVELDLTGLPPENLIVRQAGTELLSQQTGESRLRVWLSTTDRRAPLLLAETGPAQKETDQRTKMPPLPGGQRHLAGEGKMPPLPGGLGRPRGGVQPRPSTLPGPSDAGAESSASEARKPRLQGFRLLDEEGRIVRHVDLLREKGVLGPGFGAAKIGPPMPASSYHRRVPALWNIASDLGLSTAVVGWWATWPAEKVKGVMVSSRLGLLGSRGQRGSPPAARHLRRIVSPGSFLPDLQKLYFGSDEIRPEMGRRFLDPWQCPNKAQEVLKHIYWQDAIYHDLATHLAARPGQVRLLMTYYQGIDVASHQFLEYRRNPVLARKNHLYYCSEDRLLHAVDRYYEIIDGRLGEWLSLAGPETTILVLSDHGQVPGEIEGLHADNGFMVLWGRAILPGTALPAAASVFDVAPTVLRLLDLPVPGSMEGTPLEAVLDPGLPPVKRGSRSWQKKPDKPAPPAERDEELDQNLQERLKALGYLE